MDFVKLYKLQLLFSYDRRILGGHRESDAPTQEDKELKAQVI
jgi:hypothetical protein